MYLGQDVPRDKLTHCVVEERRRPELPLECPLDYHLLASRCWETDPSIRCVGGLRVWGGRRDPPQTLCFMPRPSFEQIFNYKLRLRHKQESGSAASLALQPGPPTQPQIMF